MRSLILVLLSLAATACAGRVAVEKVYVVAEPARTYVSTDTHRAVLVTNNSGGVVDIAVGQSLIHKDVPHQGLRTVDFSCGSDSRIAAAIRGVENVISISGSRGRRYQYDERTEVISFIPHDGSAVIQESFVIDCSPHSRARRDQAFVLEPPRSARASRYRSARTRSSRAPRR